MIDYKLIYKLEDERHIKEYHQDIEMKKEIIKYPSWLSRDQSTWLIFTDNSSTYRASNGLLRHIIYGKINY